MAAETFKGKWVTRVGRVDFDACAHLDQTDRTSEQLVFKSLIASDDAHARLINTDFLMRAPDMELFVLRA